MKYWICVNLDKNQHVLGAFAFGTASPDIDAMLVFRSQASCERFVQIMKSRVGSPIACVPVDAKSDADVHRYLEAHLPGPRRTMFVFEDSAEGIDLLDELGARGRPARRGAVAEGEKRRLLDIVKEARQRRGK